jgi:probable O-glycosylation ligase (exosortase A-associated)
MADIFILFIFLFFLFFGITRPYVAFCGYIWVDIFNPQKISFGFLSTLPMSLTMGLICFCCLLFNMQKIKKPSNFKIIGVLVLFAAWITITTVFSYFPIWAWFKWDVAIKTMLMTILFCFVINKKEQLELCFATFALSASYFIVTSGTKTILGGGGYGVNLITAAGNSGISESSTLAMVAVMLIPMVLFFKRNTLLFSSLRNKKFVWFVPIIFIIACVIGTQARTGLVAFVIFVLLKVATSSNKFRNITLLSILAVFAFSFVVSDDWKQRMGTINNASADASASGRMLVWQWTFDFAKSHPVGGGFNAYLANGGLWQAYADVPIEGEKPKAFHSIYFEVLGEHGFMGLFLFLTFILLAWLSNKQVIKNSMNSEKGQWLNECGTMLNHSIIIFCISGAFIGVAFQPFIYYLVAFSIILKKIEHNSNA